MMSAGRVWQPRRVGRRLLSRLVQGRPAGLAAYLFVAHRLSGVILTVYLYVHLVTLGTVLQGPQGFDRAMVLMSGPTVRLLELGLVGLVLFHTLNGLRLCLLAVLPSANQRWLAYGVMGLLLIVLLASVPFFWQ